MFAKENGVLHLGLCTYFGRKFHLTYVPDPSITLWKHIHMYRNDFHQNFSFVCVRDNGTKFRLLFVSKIDQIKYTPIWMLHIEKIILKIEFLYEKLNEKPLKTCIDQS